MPAVKTGLKDGALNLGDLFIGKPWSIEGLLQMEQVGTGALRPLLALQRPCTAWKDLLPVEHRHSDSRFRLILAALARQAKRLKRAEETK